MLESSRNSLSLKDHLELGLGATGSKSHCSSPHVHPHANIVSWTQDKKYILDSLNPELKKEVTGGAT